MREDVARLLTIVEVEVRVFALDEVASQRTLAFAPATTVAVHYVREGSGHIEVEGFDAIPVSTGSVLLVPPGRARRAKANGPALQLASASVSASCGGQFGLLDALMRPVVASAADIPALGEALEAIIDEQRMPDVGTPALVGALMKQCLILLVRSHLHRGNELSAFFQALSEPQLLAAISLILSKPEADLRVATLAAEAGMSSAAFVKRFAAVVGQAPIAFVHGVRLRRAAHLLGSTGLPIKLIAWSSGFSSRSHFSRAFTQAYGADPSAYREQTAELLVVAG